MGQTTEKRIREMIQKLEQSVIGTNYGCGGASFSEVIDKVNEVIDYINSQPEEKPSENLKEEVKRYYSDNFTYISSDQPTLSILTNVARHFAEWQKEQMMDEWLKDRDGCFWDGVSEGKKAMKEQMMKEAVEGYVTFNCDAQEEGLPCATVIANEKPMEFYENLGFKLGDKVRIIIVKED